MNNRTYIIAIVVLLILAAIGLYVMRSNSNKTPDDIYSPALGADSEDNTDTSMQPAVAKDGCYIGGCSQQVCSEDPNAMSTCEYRDAYACYKTGTTCEKQASGKCGWTETTELTSCLQSALQEK